MSFRSPRARKHSRPVGRSCYRPPAIEELEGREVPATLAPIDDFTTPNTKALYVPLTVSNAVGTVTYSASSTDPQVQVQVVAGGTTIRLHVTGVDGTNTPFDGNLTFRLFDSLAPITTARIVALVNQGFYNNLTFHRILDGFVAQGGDPSGNGTGGSGTTIPDEFNTLLTFNSPGLLAMANSGDDTGDSQFFITDTDLSLAQQPQHLNFNHTIFGQLVDGFSTFTALMSTPVNSPNIGTPNSTVRIVSASVIADDPNGVLRVTAPANYTGTTAITVTPSDGGSSTGDTFNVSFVADTVNEPPFLNPVADQTTSVGTGVTFQLTGTDLENDAKTFEVVSATANGQVVTVGSQIDQATGKVTVTPPAGFAGVIDLKVGVKNAAGTRDTQVIRLTVTGSFDLQTTSDSGALNDDNITGVPNPTLTVLGPAGAAVSVTVNGTTAGVATATSTPGRYNFTIPAGLLRVGTNVIAGTTTVGSGSPTPLTPFTLTYAPSLRSVYTVPGAAGTTQQLTFSIRSGETSARSEYGYFKVDSLGGRIGTLNPGDAGYFAAAMARRVVVFSTSAAAGDSKTVTVTSGDLLAMYLIQNDTSTRMLASNSSNTRGAGALAFFSLTGANPDQIAHVSASDDPLASQVIYGFEDGTGGGDRDYNDMVVSVRRTGDTALSTLQVPGAANRSVSTTAQLQTARRSASGANPITGTAARGEIGFFVADTINGAIGQLTPGSAGYAAAALARAQILFANGAASGATRTLDLGANQFLVFYFVPNGTAAQVASSNPTNAASGSKIAYFSIPAANPDGQVHSRTVSPEKVSRAAPTATDPYWVHMMGKLNGVAADFDDAVFTIRFGS